jgi:hypothetical protein
MGYGTGQLTIVELRVGVYAVNDIDHDFTSPSSEAVGVGTMSPA